MTIIIIIYNCSTKKSLCRSGWCSCSFPHLFSRDVQFGYRADNRLSPLRSSVVILKYMVQQYIDYATTVSFQIIPFTSLTNLTFHAMPSFLHIQNRNLFSTLKMEAVCSTETLVPTHRRSRGHFLNSVIVIRLVTTVWNKHYF